MINTYSLRRLSVELSTPLKYDLTRTVNEIKKAFEQAKQQEKRVGTVEYEYTPRKRWRVTYLKSRFKHRKAIRHYVFEQYNYKVSVFSPEEVETVITSILGSLSTSVQARCTFTWNYENGEEERKNKVKITNEENKIEESIINKLINKIKKEKEKIMIGIGRLYRFQKNVRVNLTESQQLLREKLDRLTKELSTAAEENKGTFSFFKKRREGEQKSPKGVYIYGGVGQGKTMMMDMFYEKVETTKHRIHFHEFMIQVQKKLHENRNSSGSVSSPLSGVCSEIAREYRLLCLDEFHVTHISDAMILKELFTNLFKMGLVLVCTSNRAPEELYKNGLNRDRFLPFIPILYKHCEVFNLNSEDFRQKIVSESTKLDKQLFFLEKNIEDFMEEYARENEISKEEIRPMKLQVTPLRSILLKRTHGKVAFFEFSDFSSTKRGAVGTDSFIEMSSSFHTLYVSKVPQFDTNVQNNNQLKIFIQLIDILYEKNMKLILSTEKPIIFMFGLFGIVKLFDEFYNNFKEEEQMLDLKASIQMEDFIEIASKYKMNSSDSAKLFNSMLLPNEDTLTAQRLYNIVKTYSDLRRGEITKDFTLYKFDTSEENINEEEFQCSRTLSRLFHMSTSDYLEKHKQLYK
ncbi:uncharacterized protein TOT_030000956 [Theileria orientalis strain Shintoku]|uniref:ATPase n=1 Tax=Theileria orientalis strain Shintoku TaxID=869250 RepID=J4CDR5_THEOR|nr:uncharacterized protein TOT_030000956 [Theileria orientalis strain Shintoku]BAM41602.1 uncharacterized protein TOT_030000956 [Theileria orientalis strain Shintoku]|eukprot:XP_009691903.1 uncharacterized protein TOT_030000956 [Theileria orientalis strain Shintoku]